MSGFLDSSTIRSKLHRPPVAADVIERTSLLDAYPIGERGCATLVAAPAGYGKSTYVCQSLDRSAKRCAWLSLDAADSELRRLLTYIAAAIETQFPSACEELLACREMPVFYPPLKLAQIFAGEIEALNEPLILVLDDYHEISGAAVHEFLSELLTRQPANLHLVIVTRRDPPLPLQSLRAKGQLMEVRFKQLTFSSDEDDALKYVGEILAAFRGGDEHGPGVEKSAPAPARGEVESLSKREHQVLKLIAERFSNKEIASELHRSEVTVKRHTANIYQKLGVHGRRQAVSKAEGLGVISSNPRLH